MDKGAFGNDRGKAKMVRPKNVLKNIFIGLGLLGLVTYTASAQWAEVGKVADISSVAVIGSNIYILSHGRVFLSINNGANWAEANSGLPANTGIGFLTVSGNNIYAVTGGRIFLSTNNGTSWTEVNTSFPANTIIQCLSVMDSNIFVGTIVEPGTAILSCSIYRSVDKGASWSKADSGIPFLITQSIAASGANILAGTNAGLYLSKNNGKSWTAVDSGLPHPPNYVNARCLSVSGNNIFMTGVDPYTLSGTVFLSIDNGISWTPVDSGLPPKTSVLCLAVSGGNIFAGTGGGGIFLLSNNGTSWAAVNSGLLANTAVVSLAVSGGNLFAATNFGLFLSTNNGTTWTAAKNDGLQGYPVGSFTVSDNNVFAGTNGNLLLSTNNGATWTVVEYIPGNYLFTSGSNIFASNGFNVFLSANIGASWTAVYSGYFEGNGCSGGGRAQCFTVIGNTFFAGNGCGGVFRSSNNGTSWTIVNNREAGYSPINCIAGNGSNIIFGAGNGIICRSTDNGTTWNNIIRISLAGPPVTYPSITTLAVSDSSFFAGTSGAGVILSSNNGASWTAVNFGLTNLYVNCLTISGTNIYAGTRAGVFQSVTNGIDWNGTKWTAVNDGLPATTGINCLAASSSNLFAGNSDGIWRRPLLEMGVVNPQQMISKPCANGFKINVCKNGIALLLPQSLTKGIVTVGLFTIAGKKVYSATHQASAGTLNIPVAGLSTDTYLMSIKGGTAALSSPFVVAK
jgi:hypothetical protein